MKESFESGNIRLFTCFPLFFNTAVVIGKIKSAFFATRGSSVRVRLAPLHKYLYRKDLTLPSDGRK